MRVGARAVASEECFGCLTDVSEILKSGGLADLNVTEEAREGSYGWFSASENAVPIPHPSLPVVDFLQARIHRLSRLRA